MLILYLITGLFFASQICKCEDGFYVKIEEGRLKGVRLRDKNNEIFYNFMKIPYAKPPVGKLRFQPPEKIEAWNGTLDATKDMPRCVQDDYFGDKEMIGEEDCLYLSVQTPELSTSSEGLRTVMVYIHGGGFDIGSGQYRSYGAEYLMPAGVVLVNINYRLGLWGFLNSNQLGISGNMGLRDQNLALQWVQRNIHHFGGDPKKVTLFGNSAGGASAHYHILSPMSKGLFQRAILQSGVAINPWVYGAENTGMELAKQLGVDGQPTEKIAGALVAASVPSILKAQKNMTPPPLNIRKPLRSSPVVERSSVEPKFVPDTPLKLMESNNNVSILLGHTDMEGPTMEFVVHCIDNPDATQYIPAELNVPMGSALEKEVAEKIQERYPLPEKCLHLLSDLYFVHGVMKSAKMHQKHSAQVFFYIFTFDTDINYFKTALKLKHIKGAVHTDELGYLFKRAALPEVKPNTLEERYVDAIVKIWTNFAKFGNMTFGGLEHSGADWKPLGKEMNYCELNASIKCGTGPNEDVLKFWDDIYSKYMQRKQ